MLRILAIAGCLILSGFSANPASARAAHVKVQRIHTRVLQMDGIDMRVRWAPDQREGTLDMRVDRLRAPSIAGDYRSVRWNCRLNRVGWRTWRCTGPISLPGTASADFSVDFRPEGLDVALKHGSRLIRLQRRARAPELTSIDLQSLPVAWARAFIRRGWQGGRLETGSIDGQLSLQTPRGGGVAVTGPLALRNASLRTNDGSIIAENVQIAGNVSYLGGRGSTSVALAGSVLGDMLAGNTFVSIQDRPARFDIAADSLLDGWHFKRIHWVDGATLRADGTLDWTANGFENLDLRFASDDARLLRDRYLSGFLGPIGLSDVELSGGLSGWVESIGKGSPSFSVSPRALTIRRPDARLVINGLNGDIALSQGKTVASRLRWQDATVYGLAFGSGDLPLSSANGELSLRQTAYIPVFNGRLRFDNMRIRPPRGERGLGLSFALGVEDVDFGALSQAVGFPAFRGRLNGTLPNAVYENDVLRLDGGLDLDVFDGRVAFSSLSVERPFGPAPTLVTNVDLARLDLLRLTEVLGFGSITGKLSGRIHDLRLIDWTPVRFDAELHTVKVSGVPQRISQRAVKNISSVGGTSPAGGLQGMALELFKDFGYSKIGIQCRLVNSVCTMSGLAGDSTSGSGSDSFTILKGAGIPRLTVIGHNRRVDWPVLVDRLKAVAAGDVKPVIEH